MKVKWNFIIYNLEEIKLDLSLTLINLISIQISK